MLNGISHRYQLEQSISLLRHVRWYSFFYFFNQILIEHSASKQWRPRSGSALFAFVPQKGCKSYMGEINISGPNDVK